MAAHDPNPAQDHSAAQERRRPHLPVEAVTELDQAFTELVEVLAGDLPVTVTGRAQAQGDLLVWPWPASQAPAERARAVAGTAVVPAGRVVDVLDGRHVLMADGPRVTWGGQVSASGLTLGTLVVGAASVALLCHPEHTDLRIGGPGVYVIRREHEATVLAPNAEPAPELDWRAVID